MNRQIDKKKVMQVLIDVKWHKYARVAAAEQGRTIKSLVEEGLEMVIDRLPTSVAKKDTHNAD